MIRGGEVETARGAIREGVAAIQHLGQLLRSLKVGPRALAQALPEVFEACRSLKAAFESLRGALVAQMGDDSDVLAKAGPLLTFASKRVDDLARALDGQQKRPLEARRRLAIEAEVRKVSRDLDTVLCIIELIAAGAAPRPSSVELVDVLGQLWCSAPSNRTAPAFVELGESGAFSGDPKIAAMLLELAVSVLRNDGLTAAAVVRAERDEGRLVVRVSARETPPPREKEPPPKRDRVAAFRGGPAVAPPSRRTPAKIAADENEGAINVPIHACVPDAIATACAVARQVGFDLRIHKGAGVVTIAL